MSIEEQLSMLSNELQLTQIQKKSHFDAGRKSTDREIRINEMSMAKLLQQEELNIVERIKQLSERTES